MNDEMQRWAEHYERGYLYGLETGVLWTLIIVFVIWAGYNIQKKD